jgi:hypothetical protein
MKKLLTYFSIGMVVLKLVVWYADKKLKDDINSIFEATDYRQPQIDSLSTLRIKLEEVDSVNSSDRSRYDLLQKIKNEEKRLLKLSLGQYLDAKAKADNQSNFLNTMESIFDAFILLSIGALIFYLIKAH